jgi:hypothetical protein
VDLQELREWQVDAAIGRFRAPVFSPGCNFVALLVAPADGDAEVRVIVDTSSGRIVDRCQHLPGAEEDLGHFAADGGCFVIGYRDDEDKDHIRTVSTLTGKTAVIARARRGSPLLHDSGSQFFQKDGRRST